MDEKQKLMLMDQHLVECAFQYQYDHLTVIEVDRIRSQDIMYLGSKYPSDYEYDLALKRVSGLTLSGSDSIEYCIYRELMFMYRQIIHWNKFMNAHQMLKNLESSVDGDDGHDLYYDNLYNYYEICDNGFKVFNEEDVFLGYCSELGGQVEFASVVTKDEPELSIDERDDKPLNVFERYMSRTDKYNSSADGVIFSKEFTLQTLEGIVDEYFHPFEDYCKQPEDDLKIKDSKSLCVNCDSQFQIETLFSYSVLRLISTYNEHIVTHFFRELKRIPYRIDHYKKLALEVCFFFNCVALRGGYLTSLGLSIDIIRRFYPV